MPRRLQLIKPPSIFKTTKALREKGLRISCGTNAGQTQKKANMGRDWSRMRRVLDAEGGMRKGVLGLERGLGRDEGAFTELGGGDSERCRAARRGNQFCNVRNWKPGTRKRRSPLAMGGRVVPFVIFELWGRRLAGWLIDWAFKIRFGVSEVRQERQGCIVDMWRLSGLDEAFIRVVLGAWICEIALTWVV
jgi:hypothetical protein